jgi:DNA-binding transcriptional ArsR family regulator
MAFNTTTVTDFQTGEEKILNTGFSQIYHSWWRVQRILIDENPTALKIFSWLIEIADRRNAVVVSYAAISKSVNLCERTIRKSISYLKKNHLLTVLKSGNMNVYILNDRVVWKDTANTKDKYSKFSAEVYLIASEQEEQYRSELIGHAVPKAKNPKNAL